MKDFLKQEISVGDNVVFVSGRYVELNKGVVVKITAQKVKIASPRFGDDGVTIYPSQLIVRKY